MDGKGILQNVQRHTQDFDLAFDDILPYLNAALDDVSQEAQLPAEADATITLDKDEYTIPVNYLVGTLTKVTFKKNKTDAKDITLDKISFADVNESDGRDTPSYFYVRGNKFGMYPKTDTAGLSKIYYNKRIPSMTTETDVPMLNESYHSILELFISARLSQENGETTKFNQFMQEYEIKKQQLKLENANAFRKSRRVKPARWI